MIQGMIFDMDGLLFDTERVWDSLWPVCFEQLGLPLPPPSFYSDGRGMSGKNAEVNIRRYYPQADTRQIILTIRSLSEERFAQGVPVKPGATELLAWLEAHGLPRIIASSSPRRIVELNLRTTGLARYFPSAVCGEDVRRSKPDPEVFLSAAKRLGLDIRHCLVLEDSFNGVRAGHASGAFTIMVPDLAQPTPEILSLCDSCCKNLFEVKALLESGADFSNRKI